MRDLWLLIKNKLKHLFSMNDDAAKESDVISGIISGIEFRGAKLWILILAVFVASLGLNTNSAAVIIGAMLISPLMGPIIGIGLGMGIYDFDLLKRSARNYLIATIFSVITATLYFLISPYSEVQSELLARTSPTIYDVLIALCGGLAGIIALGSRSQRTGNVIPGVAIATALMPPLCTVGFGLATANWSYAAGALYLYAINTIFIAGATFVGARWIMRFHAKAHLDPRAEKRTRTIITTLLLVTIIPSVFLTINMVRESYFNQQVNLFVQKEMRWPMTQVISHRSDFDNRSFSVVLVGAEVDSIKLSQARDKMAFYGLENVDMQVMQASNGINEDELQSMMNANNSELHRADAIIAQQQADMAELERELQQYRHTEQLGKELYDELRTLYPQVERIFISRGVQVSENVADTTHSHLVEPETQLVLILHDQMTKAERERLESWLQLRVDSRPLHIEVRNK